MLTPSKPDPGVIEWLWESFDERQRIRRRRNPSSRHFLGLLDDHDPNCTCVNGAWHPAGHDQHVMNKRIRTVAVDGGNRIPVFFELRPPWLHPHP